MMILDESHDPVPGWFMNDNDLVYEVHVFDNGSRVFAKMRQGNFGIPKFELIHLIDVRGLTAEELSLLGEDGQKTLLALGDMIDSLHKDSRAQPNFAPPPCGVVLFDATKKKSARV